jgi:hypothetical protein
MKHVDNHKTHPEIWLQPSPPHLSLNVLSTLIEIRSLTATPRLGARNSTHPKGYEPGQIAMLRVGDERGHEHLKRRVRIEAVTIKPLQNLTPDDLHHTVSYNSWEEVQRDLSFFEKRPVKENEDTSIIEFSYL